MADDITHQILHRMRNDLNARIDETNTRMTEMEARIEGRIEAGFASLTGHAVSANTHLATLTEGLHEQSAQLLMLSRFLRNSDFKSRIDQVEARVTRLEGDK